MASAPHISSPGRCRWQGPAHRQRRVAGASSHALAWARARGRTSSPLRAPAHGDGVRGKAESTGQARSCNQTGRELTCVQSRAWPS